MFDYYSRTIKKQAKKIECKRKVKEVNVNVGRADPGSNPAIGDFFYKGRTLYTGGRNLKDEN